MNEELSRLIEILADIDHFGTNNPSRMALVGSLDRFTRFFQETQFCVKCESPLFAVTQPTKDLAPDSDEHGDLARKNDLLDAILRLQQLGKLSS